MRDYGKVYTAFWTSEDARGLSEDGRTLALYLLSCPHGNMLGCFRLTNAYAADDLAWMAERVSKGFDELFSKGFAYRCERTSWTFIRQYLKWNQFENPNVALAAGKLFDSLSCPALVKSLLTASLREYAPKFSVEKLDEYESVAEPFENPFGLSAKTRTTTPTNPTAPAGTKQKRSAPDGDEYPPEFEEAWVAYPQRPGASKKNSFKAWSARVKSGVTAEQLLDGVVRYAAFVKAKSTEPDYIKQPETFFGPGEHYKADWTVQPRASPAKPEKFDPVAHVNRNRI